METTKRRSGIMPDDPCGVALSLSIACVYGRLLTMNKPRNSENLRKSIASTVTKTMPPHHLEKVYPVTIDRYVGDHLDKLLGNY